MDNRLIVLTTTDASLQCGLLWDLDHVEPLEILGTGVADSATARRLALLFSAHEDARQPAAQRLAAYRGIAQLVLQRLFEPSDPAARKRWDVLAAVLELGDADQAKVGELERRMEECVNWAVCSETAAAAVVLSAIDTLEREPERADHGLNAWCKTTELLAALAPLVAPAEVESVMRRAAELAYAHLFAR